MATESESRKRDARLDALAIRIGGYLDGENLLDVSSVTAMLCAYSIIEAYDNPMMRTAALDEIFEFMSGIVERGR